MNLADTWHATIAKAATLRPDLMYRALVQALDPVPAANVLRAASYDIRVSSSGEPSDPTASSALSGMPGDRAPDIDRDLGALARADRAFITHAGTVLDWVCGDTPTTWADCVARARRLQPGTVQAGIDVDHDRHLPHAIAGAAAAVHAVADIAARHAGIVPRRPSGIERSRQTQLPDQRCCTLHLAAHAAYRVERVDGGLLCRWCQAIVNLAHGRLPPPQLLDLMVAEDPAFSMALERWLDEVA